MSRMTRFAPIPSISVLCLFACLVAPRPASGVDLLFEDFEDLTLNPVVTFYSELREREAWTTTTPAPYNTETWTIDNSQMPPEAISDPYIGVAEFEGWTFVDRDWWIATAGGQSREEFSSASGTIMVADSDEWDDFPSESGTQSPTEYGDFDSTMRISGIDLQGAAAYTANLTFFSSWRPEGFDDGDNTNNQTATLTVTYNDPAETSFDVFVWDSDEDGPNYKEDATNEFVNVPLLNPAGATEATIEFRLSHARNDWWWAIDDISMFTGSAPDIDGALRMVIDRDTREVKIVNNTGQTVNLRGYIIESSNGTLDESVADYLADSSADWIVLDNPESSELSEGHISSYAMPDVVSDPINGEIDLGLAWRKFYADYSDISFSYLVDGVETPLRGIVEFTGNGDESYEFLDLNFDGAIDLGDYLAFLDGYGSASLEDKLKTERYSLGDLDDNGEFSIQDFLAFKLEFDRINGAGAFAAMLAVPEPTTALLLVAGCLIGFAGRRKTRLLALLLVVAVLSAPRAAQAQLTLYSEDFEGVALGQSPEEDDTQMNVWNGTGPAGWTVDDSGMPFENPGVGRADPPIDGDGVEDWNGWAFVDYDFWIDAAGEQNRELFTRASGTVMVADPDEWEDDGTDDPGPESTIPSTANDMFDALVTTHTISIPTAHVPAGKLMLAFDSSWRDEAFDDGAVSDLNNQTATIRVSYDGGAFSEVMRWESDPESDDFKDDAENENVVLDLGYDGIAGSIQVEFGLGQAWNDWWWAVDNIRLFVPADPSILQIDVSDGTAELIGGDLVNVDINAIDIQSVNGNLAPAADAGLSYTKPDSIGTGINETWQLAAANENFFSEFFLDGYSSFTNARIEDLGKIFDTGTSEEDRDVTFTYTNIYGTEIEGIVEYIGPPPVVDADFDSDGDVDLADLMQLQRGFGLTGQTDNSNGDANSDGIVNALDLDTWRSEFGSSSSASATAVVPEPSSAVLMLLSVAGLLGMRRRSLPATGAALAIVVSLFTLTGSASAAVSSPTLDRDYKLGDGDSVTAGNSVSSTKDDAGVGPSSTQQLVPLSAASQLYLFPKYVSVNDRPDGVTGLGIQLNQFGYEKNYLTTIPQLALNLPIRSPSSTQSDFGTGSIDYQFITDRGFELWTKPTALPTTEDAHIVMDTNNHGVLIQTDGTFAMRYAGAGKDYAGVTTAVPGTWYHLSVVRSFGPSSGSVLYVNGVAEAAATGTYVGEQDLTGDEILPPESLDDSPLTVGTNTAENPVQHAISNYYSGVVDDLEMYVMGFNNTSDFGEYVFERDNGYAAVFKPTVDGDLDNDLDVDLDDAAIFAGNWLYEKRLEWTVGEDERSLRVGDLESRSYGDFNYDGIVNLADWGVLNDANPAAAVAAMRMISTSVPEPTTLGLCGLAALFAFTRRRRR